MQCKIHLLRQEVYIPFHTTGTAFSGGSLFMTDYLSLVLEWRYHSRSCLHLELSPWQVELTPSNWTLRDKSGMWTFRFLAKSSAIHDNFSEGQHFNWSVITTTCFYKNSWWILSCNKSYRWTKFCWTGGGWRNVNQSYEKTERLWRGRAALSEGFTDVIEKKRLILVFGLQLNASLRLLTSPVLL